MEIRWHINPMRGEAFEEAWLPAAEAAVDYGATRWGLYRAEEGRLDFIQHAVFPTKEEFDRYWYSEEIAEVRTNISGLYQVPLLPTYHAISGSGVTAEAPAAS